MRSWRTGRRWCAPGTPCSRWPGRGRCRGPGCWTGTPGRYAAPQAAPAGRPGRLGPGGDRRLRDVGRRHPDRPDQLMIQVAQHMPLVAVHPDAAGLAAVAHLRIVDRDPPVLCDPPPDARPALPINDGVLLTDLP